MKGERANLSAAQLLFWCIAGAAAIQFLLWGTAQRESSPIFWTLLRIHDGHGNFILAAVAAAAFALQRHGEPLALVRLAADRPWLLAALAFPALCIGSLFVYEAYPLSMDEYSTYFQGQVFAAGKLSGVFPPDLLDRLIPHFFQGGFFRVSRITGEVGTGYWPGFALLLAPFCWLGVPWAVNPLIAALTIPAIHGIAREVTASREAAGWAVLLTLASPVFIVTSISLYSMPAHLLLGLWYAWLLLRPTPRRAALAGFIGSLALTLHFPARHVLFALPFAIWLLWRPDRVRNVAALLAGYLPLGLLLGLGWHVHAMDLAMGAASSAEVAPGGGEVAAAKLATPAVAFLEALRNASLPSWPVIESRLAGLSKVWTWGAAGLMVLAAYGALISWRSGPTRLLIAAFAAIFLGYFLVGGDQGHGWGNRSLYGAWFVVPLLAARALASPGPNCHADALRAMAAWAVALSLVFSNGLRLLQVDTFIERHLRQVPPLAQAPDPRRPEIVFVNIRSGFYAHDMIQNDPFLRGPRIVMMLGSSRGAEALMASRFPSYRKKSEGDWGQWWERTEPD